jgi:anti-sigma regulatory factor (Ser/Thr protein kinase)
VLAGVASEAAEDVVLALNEVATNTMLYGSTGGQPVQVVVHVGDGVVQASVLDHGPPLPAQPPTGG